MAFKVVVRENNRETYTASYTVDNRTQGCPEISDEYQDGFLFRIDDGRLSVYKDGTVVSIYQNWCRVVPVDKKESK